MDIILFYYTVGVVVNKSIVCKNQFAFIRGNPHVIKCFLVSVKKMIFLVGMHLLSDY